MADWPIHPSIARQAACGGAIGIVSGGVNTKGAYSTLVASTEFDINLLVFSNDYSPYTCDYLIDIAIGAAGAEQVIIGNLIHSTVLDEFYDSAPFYAPIKIPAGSRLSARSQCSTATQTSYIFCNLYQSSLIPTFGAIDTYGANLGDSGGTQLAGGSVAWAKGSYVEITSSTVRSIKGIIVGSGNILNTTRASTSFFVDIAIGTTNNEVIVAQDIHFSSTYGMSMLPRYLSLIPVNIPLGARISARVNCGTTDATDKLIDVILYAFC